MTVIMFMARFAPRVADGSKPHTIRPKRKRPIRVGDRLSLRRWADLAYRSPQIVLREAVCSRIGHVVIEPVCLHGSRIGTMLGVDGKVLDGDEREAFARADGFDDFAEMATWFESTHGLPFQGPLICWATP